MTLKRYQLIEHFFQINSKKYSKNMSLEKVLPLLQIFENFSKVYHASNKLALDEIIAPFIGRFQHLSYNPMKPDKWGIKLYGVADSLTGYCLSLIPYLGQDTYKFFHVKDLNGLVINTMERFGNPGASIYIDNYYCNFTVAQELLSMGYNVTGTFRQSRRDVPKIIKEAKVKKVVKKVNKGITQPTIKRKKSASFKEPSKEIRYFKNDSGIFAIKWRSKREVTVLTTNHLLDFEVRDSARMRPVNRPIVVHEYNQYMRGIDRLNQRTHYIK